MLSTLSDSPTRGPLLSGPSYFIPIPAFGPNSSDFVCVYTSVSPGPGAPPGPGGMDHKPTHVLTQQPRKKTCFVPITVTHGAPQASPSNCQLSGTAAVRISVKTSMLTFQIFTPFLLFGPVLRSPQAWDGVGVSESAGVTAVGTRPAGTPRQPLPPSLPEGILWALQSHIQSILSRGRRGAPPRPRALGALLASAHRSRGHSPGTRRSDLLGPPRAGHQPVGSPPEGGPARALASADPARAARVGGGFSAGPDRAAAQVRRRGGETGAGPAGALPSRRRCRRLEESGGVRGEGAGTSPPREERGSGAVSVAHGSPPSFSWAPCLRRHPRS